MPCFRNHCSAVLGSHWALKITARATSKPPSVRDHSSGRLLCTRQQSKTPPKMFFSNIPLDTIVWQPLGVRNHCSGMLRRHLALEIATRAGFFVLDRTRTQGPTLFFQTFRSTSLLGRAALESTAQVCLEPMQRSRFFFERALWYSEEFSPFPSQILSKLRTVHCSRCALRDSTSITRCHMRD